MSEKQLTVAELLAKAGREGEGGGEETPRRRRRRSVDSGGVSVAELTGRIPKVEAKPTESRHSSSPLDAEETYTGPFSAVASNSLFGDSPTEAGHVTSLFNDHGDIGQAGLSQTEHPDPSEPPATLSFFSNTDNPGGAMGGGPGGSGASGDSGVSGGPISSGAGHIGGVSGIEGSSYTSSNARDAVPAAAAHQPPVATAPSPAAAASSTIADSAPAESAVVGSVAGSSATAKTTPSAPLPTMPKPMIRPAMKPVMKPVMKQSLTQDPVAPLTPEGESERPFADLTPGDDSTIVLSVVDEGGPVRLTTGTFPRLKDHHFTKASVEDLAQPPELPMQKKTDQPTRAEKALTESFQKVSDESETAARLGYRTAGHDTYRGASDDVADVSANTFTDDSETETQDHTMIAGFPAIAEPEDVETSEFDDSENMGETSIDESGIEDVDDGYGYEETYEYDEVDEGEYSHEPYSGGMFTTDDFGYDDGIEDVDDTEDAVDDSEVEAGANVDAPDATGVMEFEESGFDMGRFEELHAPQDDEPERFPYPSSHLSQSVQTQQEDDEPEDLPDDGGDMGPGRPGRPGRFVTTHDDIDDPADDPFIDNFDEFEEEFEDDFDEESSNEKMSVLAILGMAAVGVLVGVGVFAGFQILWDSISNKLIVAGLACVAITVIVGAVHMLRTSWDGFSMTLAGLVGVTMTFGPLAIVNMAA